MSEVKTLGSERTHRLREMDFRRPMKFTSEQLRQLVHAHESFCRSASMRLSAELRTEFTMDMVANDQLPYSAVMSEEVPPNSLVIILRAEPVGTDVALVIDIPTALRVVARVLGGQLTGEEGAAVSLTELEMDIALHSMTGLVDALSATWSDLCGLKFRIEDGETSAVSVQLVPPSEPTLLLTFSAEMDGELSLMTLVVPHRSVAPVIGEISINRLEDEDTDHAGAHAIDVPLGQAEVPITAVVGSKTIEVTDLLALRPGDIIRLPQRAADGVQVCVGDQPVYQAQHGAADSKVAVQILERHGQR